MFSTCGLCALATTLRDLNLDDSATASTFYHQYPDGLWPEELEAELTRCGGQLVLRKRCPDTDAMEAILKSRTVGEAVVIIEYFVDGESSHIYTASLREAKPIIYDVQAGRGLWAPDKLSSFLVYVWTNPVALKEAVC